MRLISALFLCAVLNGQDFAEISGQVIDSATKQPLAGARVVLVRMGPGASYSMRTFEMELSPESPHPAAAGFAFLTGDQGLFRCKVTAPAEFMVFVSRPGYVKWGMSFETQRTLSIKPRVNPEPLRIPLEGEGSITGRVVDADSGAPLAGLSVVALKWRVARGNRSLLSASEYATTAADGSYELKGIGAGEYKVQVDLPVRWKFSPGGSSEEFRDHREVAYGRTYYPGVEQREQAASVTLLPGASLGSIHIKLTKRRTACIRGRVFSAEGEEIAGEVPVMLGRVERQGSAMALQMIARTNVSLGSTFRLDGLPAGRYWLQSVPAKGSAPGRRAGYHFFDLDDSNLDNLELAITKGATMHGKATLHESVAGQYADVIKPEAAPRLSLAYFDRMGNDDELAPVRWQSDGSFEIQGVMDGTYKLFAMNLPAGLALGEVRYNGHRQPRGYLTLNRSALDQKLELVLYPATASIRVSVTEGMHPAKDAQVVLLAEDYDPEDPQRDAKTAQADSDGHAAFSKLIAGKYWVLAFGPDAAWRSSPALRELARTAAKVVEVGTGASAGTDAKLTAIE
ncbi:MAG: carboxypeptidase-like regulatory domain-containing protein [Paludibaculum sp.]